MKDRNASKTDTTAVFEKWCFSDCFSCCFLLVFDSIFQKNEMRNEMKNESKMVTVNDTIVDEVHNIHFSGLSHYGLDAFQLAWGQLDLWVWASALHGMYESFCGLCILLKESLIFL